MKLRYATSRQAVLVVFIVATLSPVEGGSLVINEVHPDPAGGGAAFVELSNPTRDPVDASGWRLSGDVSCELPPGSRLPPFSFLVLASDPEAFRAAYGFPAHARLVGTLDPEAVSLLLSDREGAFGSRAVYRLDADSWARSGGASLELLAPALDGSARSSWAPSLFLGGTPGAENARRVSWTEDPVVPQGAVWKYFKGIAEPPGASLAWTQPGYADAAWLEGTAPFGFGNFDEATPLDDMRSSYSSVYFRRELSYRDSGRVLDALLWVVFDDGFIAYLNGVEVARRNMGQRGTIPPHDAVATARQEAEGIADEHHLPAASSLLREGTNVLAIHAANDHVRGNDFALHAALSISSGFGPEAPGPRIVLNEVWIEGGSARVEIFNPGDREADFSGAKILGGPAGPGAMEAILLPPGLRLAPRGFLTVSGPGTFLERKLVIIASDGKKILDAAQFPAPLSGGSAGRFPDGGERIRLLPSPTPGASNAAPVPGTAVISEIQYNPIEPDAELVEIQSRVESLDLGGWSLAGAIRFRFPPGTVLSRGESLAVARDPSLVVPPDPAARILGPYKGRLANDSEEVFLLDPEGRPIDWVRYADDGAWPAAADGGGPSLELVDASRENESPLAWRASLIAGGTPGSANSVADSGAPPVIDAVSHFPIVPDADASVLVRARIEPVDSTAELLWRKDGEPGFFRLPMTAAGAMREASVPPQPYGTVVELAIEASLPGGGAAATHFPPGEPGTLLYQVEAREDSPLLPTFRLILRAKDLEALQADVTSDELRPATFATRTRAYDDVKIRNRGHGSRFVNPKSFRVRFTEENPFDGETEILLNGYRPERQVMGMDLWRRAGFPSSRARIVQLALNGQLFPRYAQVEPIEDGYLERHFGDAGGNLYRGLRAADFSYLGEVSNSYESIYEKHTNQSERDWSDVIDLARAFSSTSDAEFPAEITARIDVEEWLRWFAVNAVLSNQEGGIHRDTGDDYFLYRPAGGRFLLLPWDMDSTFTIPEEPIFRPSLPAIRRLITHPAFAPLYYRALVDLLEGSFAPEAIARQAALLEPAFHPDVVDELVTFARERSAFIRRSIPASLTAGIGADGWGSLSTLYSRSAAPELGGTAPVIGTARVTVNGVDASYTAWTGAWSLRFPLAAPETRARVAAYDSRGELLIARDWRVRRLGEGHLVESIGPGRVEWDEKGSPYVLAREITVDQGSELVLQAGTRVITVPGMPLRVLGSLSALGTPARPIFFEAAGPGQTLPGIRFEEGSSGRLEHCEFVQEGSRADPATPPEPLILAEKASLVVRHCVFRDVARVAVEVVDGEAEVSDSSFFGTLEAIHGVRSTLRALRNRIEKAAGNSDGIDLDGDAPSPAGKSLIEENTIIGVGDDGIDLLGSSATVRRNFVSGSSDRGLSIEGQGSPRIEWNAVLGCADGIALKDGTAATGSNNTVTGCGTGIRVYVKNSGSAGASGDFHSSIIWGNGADAIVDSQSRLLLDHTDMGLDPLRWGKDNFAVDPRFVSDEDLRLARGSPCSTTGRDGLFAGALPTAGQEPPAIEYVDPAAGSVEGGDVITIHGTALEGFLEARIGGRLVENARFLAAGAIQGATPRALRAGPATLEITTRSGFASLAQGYRYSRRIPRGDANGDLLLDVTDAVSILRHLFAGGAGPPCRATADWTGDERLAIDDALSLLRYLFQSGPGPESLLVDCE